MKGVTTVNDVTFNSGSYGYVDSGGMATGTVINGGIAEFAGGTNQGQSVTFTANGELKLDSPNHFADTLMGFKAGDGIDFVNIGITDATLGSGNLMTVTETGGTRSTLQFAAKQTFSKNAFYFTPDGKGGSQLAVTAALKATYNATSGRLLLSGVGLPSHGYGVTHFNVKGNGGVAYTLTVGSSVLASSASNTMAIQLSTADHLAVDKALNNNGGQAHMV